MKIDPSNFEGFNRVLTGVVVPRPIAFVSSISASGLVNLAPYSFFNAVSYDPPTIVFSSSRHAGRKAKDTLANIEETGEFVVNVVVDDIAEAMNSTAAEFPADVDEFQVAGLTACAVGNRPRPTGGRVAGEHGVPPQPGGQPGQGRAPARTGYRGNRAAPHPRRHHRRPPDKPPAAQAHGQAGGEYVLLYR